MKAGKESSNLDSCCYQAEQVEKTMMRWTKGSQDSSSPFQVHLPKHKTPRNVSLSFSTDNL